MKFRGIPNGYDDEDYQVVMLAVASNMVRTLDKMTIYIVSIDVSEMRREEPVEANACAPSSRADVSHRGIEDVSDSACQGQSCLPTC